MKILIHISGLLAVITLILAVIARLFFVSHPLFGMSALSYLRVSNTMLLFTIAFMIYDYVKHKKE